MTVVVKAFAMQRSKPWNRFLNIEDGWRIYNQDSTNLCHNLDGWLKQNIKPDYYLFS